MTRKSTRCTGHSKVVFLPVEQIVSRAKNIKAHYDDMGVDRFLVRIPGSWEGIQAVKQLEADGIPCHVTLVYR